MLLDMMLRKLAKKEMDSYAVPYPYPYPNARSRKLRHKWALDVPIKGKLALSAKTLELCAMV
jgi:hypothetical protein